jgi:hypothetical protein
MHRNVESLIGRLATDPQLRRRFAQDPFATLAELGAAGLELTEVEVEALSATDPAAFRRFAGALDRRLRRTAPITPPDPTTPGETPMRPNPCRNRRNRRARRTLGLAAVIVAAWAAESRASDWRWTLTPYAWTTDVGVDVAVGDETLVAEEISVTELLEDVDTLAQVRLEAQKGAHGLFADLFDVTLSEEATTAALPSGAGDATLTPEMGMTILEVGAIYDPSGDRRGFQLLYGARVLDERATIGVELRRADGSTASRELEVDETFVDALAGFRWIRPLSKRFTWQVQADVSKGGTELTWSAGPTLACALGENGKHAVTAGYRRMVVDFDTADAVDAKMTLSGFLAGLRIGF